MGNVRLTRLETFRWLLYGVLLATLLPCRTLHAAVAITVTPSAVSNTYTGTIKVQVTGLTIGDTVVVQKFLDANTNGVIDAGDLLVQQFSLKDGQPSVIGSVTNINVPGDTDATPGQITAQLIFHPGSIAQSILGGYVFKLSSPLGHFSPLTTFFSVTNLPAGPSVSGKVINSGTNVPNAVIILDTVTGTYVASTRADNSGHFNLSVPAGLYLLIAAKSNFVMDLSTAPIVALGIGQTVTNNLNLLPATEAITGKIVDATNASIGLPGIFVSMNSSDGRVTFGITDTNGNLTVPVTPDVWEFSLTASDLDLHGYIGLINSPQVDASAGGVSNVLISLPKGTGLFYGSVNDDQNHPLPGVLLNGYNGGGPYEAGTTTDQSGNYLMVVNSGVWHAHVDSVVPPYTNYIFSAGLADMNVTNGETIPQNLLGLVATNFITGHVIDANNHPIDNVGVAGSATINGFNFAAPSILTDGNGFYSLAVANGNWDVTVDCSIGTASLNALGYACINDHNVNIFNGNGLANFTPVPIPILSASIWSQGQFQMQLLNGATGQNYTIQSSTNLNIANWSSILVTNARSKSFPVIDHNATNRVRFYRALIGP